jgi:rhodanese-related sulfurtransferase
MAAQNGSGEEASGSEGESGGPDDAPGVATALDPERVEELIRSGEARLIDVRQPDDWERARVPGAVHIVLEEITARAGEVPREGVVVFACRGGNRSAMVADAFRTDGYDAYNMAGGVRAWEQAGLPLEGDEGTVGSDAELR